MLRYSLRLVKKGREGRESKGKVPTSAVKGKTTSHPRDNIDKKNPGLRAREEKFRILSDESSSP